MYSLLHLPNVSLLSTIALYSLPRLEEQGVSTLRDINFQVQCQAVRFHCRRDNDDDV